MFATRSTKGIAATALLLALLRVQSAYSFQHQAPLFAVPSAALRPTPARVVPSKPSSTTSSTARKMTLSDIDALYRTYPLESAIVTCGVKASVADCIAQVKSWKDNNPKAIEMQRNAAYIIYGGIFVGLMCHLEYDVLFPHMFGMGTDPATLVSKILFDCFVSAPLMWLPPAYLIKSVIFGYSFQEGIDRYITDIKGGLLTKYWSIWLPAQTVSFSFVPDHLRVAFMASISFFWFIIFSAATAETDVEAQAALDEEEAVAAETSS